MFWDPDGLTAYVMSSRSRDPNNPDQFVNVWLEYAYDVQFNRNTEFFVNERYDLPNPTNAPLTNLLQDDVLVFVHGFNVEDTNAIGIWTEEVYRRLIRAGFTGDLVVLSWLGNQPRSGEGEQQGLSGSTWDPGYFWRNVDNANLSGRNLAELIREINIANPNATVNLGAHSLGNRVALSGVRHAQENFGVDLNINSIVHMEAAVDGSVYYEKDRWYQIRGEFPDVALGANNIFNLTSRADGSDRNIRRLRFIPGRQTVRRAALGLKSPKNRRRLPPNFVSVPTQSMGISSHSAMVTSRYEDVSRFWEELVDILGR